MRKGREPLPRVSSLDSFRFPEPTKPVETSLTKQGDYMFNKV